MINNENDGVLEFNVKDMHISKFQKMAFLSSVIIGLITYLYLITNHLLNDDSVMLYCDNSKHFSLLSSMASGASTGRWYTPLVENIISPYKCPVLAGIIIILMISIMSLLCVDILNIRNNIDAALVGAILVTSPAVLEFISLYSVSYPLSALMAVLSVWILKKNKNALKYSWIILTLSLAIFPVNISCTLILMIYMLLSSIINKGVKELIIDLRNCVVTLLAAGIFWLLSSKIIMALFSVSSTGYQGSDEAMSGEFIHHFTDNLYMVLMNSYHVAFEKASIYPPLKWTLVFVYILQAICLVFLFIKKKIYKEVRKSVFYVLMILIIPVAFCTMNIVSTKFRYNAQHRMMWSVFIICGLMLIELMVKSALIQVKNIEYARKISKIFYAIVQTVFVLLVYGMILFDSIGIQNLQYVVEHDRTLMIRILASLDNYDGFDYDKPVYFCSIPSDSESDQNADDFMYTIGDEMYQISVPDSTTNLWCYGDASIRNHMKMIEGIKFKSVSQDIADKIVEKEAIFEKYSNMKPWEFDIIKCENPEVYIVVVKTVIPPLYTQS